MESMEDVIEVAVHPYREEAIVEITGTDDRGEIIVSSFMFDVDSSGDEPVATPRAPVPEEAALLVREELSEQGYRMDS